MTGVRVALLAPVRHSDGASQGARALALGLKAVGCHVTVFTPARFGGTAGMRLRPYRQPPALSPAALEELGGAAGPAVQQHHAYLDAFLTLASEAAVDVVVDDTGHYLPLALAGILEVPVLTVLREPPTTWTRPAVMGAAGGSRRLLAVDEDIAATWQDVTEVPVLRTVHDLLPSAL